MIESISGAENLNQDISETENLGQEQRDWQRIAVQIYKDSSDYLDASIRPKWGVSLANFNNQHPTGSRFVQEQYAHRSKLFRPKVKPAIRHHLAALATAMFTNNDAIYIQPDDKNSKEAAAAARMNQAVLQHRLDKDCSWFLTSLGAYQDTLVYGVCISKQFWLYDDVLSIDKLHMENLRPENFRFDPNCDWRNPSETSPYLIEIIPMYAGDVLDKIARDDEWYDYSLAEILASQSDSKYDVTRQSREGYKRTDPSNTVNGNEFSTVYVHFNVYRDNGEDIAFYTLGTTKLLSDPRPLKDMYMHGRALYRIGFSTIETHKNYPSSISDEAAPLQEEVNRLVNNRMDNVNQVLNKRFFIKRQGNVDFRSLMRNIPGGGIMVDDVNDVRWMETPDVTSSSYQEQDRLNVEADEVLGVTSPSTVQTNRAMNETVGGMNLMAAGASSDQELMIRTFIESWVEPVLNTLLSLVVAYETSKRILSNSANKAGINEFDALHPVEQDSIINTPMSLTVNVGMGNTNPEQKMKRLMLAVNTTAQMPGAAEQTDWPEVIKEVYSYAGYGDGSRFVKDQAAQQAQQDPAQAQAQAEQQQAQQESQIKLQLVQMELASKEKLEYAKLQQERELFIMEMQAKYGIESGKLKTIRDATALKERNKLNEMALKRSMGSGI